MARKELSKQAKDFRERVLEELKPELQWTNDCINIHFSFKKKGNEEYFHVDFIEDYCSHLHVRGWFNDDLIEITSVRSNVTHDMFNEVMNYLCENF